jgi:hypothetical protein
MLARRRHALLRIRLHHGWYLALAGAACTPMRGSAQLGYAQVGLAGGIALSSAGSASSVQDIGPTFGLGDRRDSPYVRATAAVGDVSLTAAAFALRETGTGTLATSFGGLVAGTAVTTDFELASLQLTAAYEFDLGAVTIAPGAALDVFALDIRVSADPQNREEVDDVVAVPLPFLRASLPLGPWRAIVEAAWLDAHDLTGADARFVDGSAMVEWQPDESFHLVTGWRHFAVDASGDSGDDRVAVDLEVRGWFVGGGVVF